MLFICLPFMSKIEQFVKETPNIFSNLRSQLYRIIHDKKFFDTTLWCWYKNIEFVSPNIRPLNHDDCYLSFCLLDLMIPTLMSKKENTLIISKKTSNGWVGSLSRFRMFGFFAFLIVMSIIWQVVFFVRLPLPVTISKNSMI